MKKRTIIRMPDASEIIPYDQANIPLYVQTTMLSSFSMNRALAHWHEDFEFIRVNSGRMNYRVNEKEFLLKAGDCLFINTKQLHAGFSHNGEDCNFSCILFHPALFSRNTALFQSCLKPLMQDSGVEFIYFDEDHPFRDTMYRALFEMEEEKTDGALGYELAIIGRMHLLFSRLMRLPEFHSQTKKDQPPQDLVSQREMVSFICRNYTERLTLDAIAASGHVSRSKCCLIFKYYVNQSPIEFLNHYRLEVSCQLLKTTGFTITQIASSCGFNHSSYYAELFLREYGCTPTAFRKRATLPAQAPVSP